MPYRAQIVKAVRKAWPYAASGATITGGGVITGAAASPPGPQQIAQGWAGIIIAVIGLGSLLIHLMANAIGPFFADRKDERDFRRQQLKVDDALAAADQAKAQVAELTAAADEARAEARSAREEAGRTRADADQARRRADRAEGRLKELEGEVAANTARTSGLQGGLEGTLELIDDLAKRGILAAPARPERPGRSRPRATVLLVEDEPSNAKALMKLLTMQGYSPTHSPTLADAADKLALFPHFVILDLKVGPADGMEILRKIHDEEIPTRVVILAGSIPPAVEAEARGLGVRCLLTKPAAFDELIHCLENDEHAEDDQHARANA